MNDTFKLGDGGGGGGGGGRPNPQPTGLRSTVAFHAVVFRSEKRLHVGCYSRPYRLMKKTSSNRNVATDITSDYIVELTIIIILYCCLKTCSWKLNKCQVKMILFLDLFSCAVKILSISSV